MESRTEHIIHIDSCWHDVNPGDFFLLSQRRSEKFWFSLVSNSEVYYVAPACVAAVCLDLFDIGVFLERANVCLTVTRFKYC